MNFRKPCNLIDRTLLRAKRGLPLSAALAALYWGSVGLSQQSAPTLQNKTNNREELSEEAKLAEAALRSALPPDSEAIAMLDAITQGSSLESGSGWFRTAVAHTRFDWPAVAARYDANGDDAISRDEFPGSDEDFRRLDRDSDRSLTQADLAWSANGLEKTPGLMLFMQADRDGNGKVTSDEFAQLFEELDQERRGFVSLDDMRDRFRDRSQHASEPGPDEPSTSTLVLGLQRQELGSLQPGPGLNDQAPDFTLPTLEGTSVHLAGEVGKLPVVLIFGNFTCGPFRAQAGNIDKLYQRYRDRAKFFLVYVREAHPSGGWTLPMNRRVGIELPQPTTDQQRCDVAGRCRSHLNLELPFLVDTVDDAVGAVYSGMPTRLYLIDAEGRIAFKSGRGPFGFQPAQMEQALILLLQESGGQDHDDAESPK